MLHVVMANLQITRPSDTGVGEPAARMIDMARIRILVRKLEHKIA